VKKPMSAKMKAFEKSGLDNDKGMKEGSAKDMKADKKQMLAMKLKGKKL
jgi:hypothetical protein